MAFVAFDGQRVALYDNRDALPKVVAETAEGLSASDIPELSKRLARRIRFCRSSGSSCAAESAFAFSFRFGVFRGEPKASGKS